MVIQGQTQPLVRVLQIMEIYDKRLFGGEVEPLQAWKLEKWC